MNPMNLEIAATPNALRRAGAVLTITTVTALGLTACGGDAEHATLGTDAAATATTGTGEAGTSTTTTIAEGLGPVLDGSDDVIAADAHITRCGVDATKSEWSANAEAYILNQEANQDLLRSKEQVLFQKIGVNAANVLADKAFTFDDVKKEFTNSDSLYTRLIARFDAVQMTPEAAKVQPTRENYRCDDIDNSGVGDVSLLRDIRSNIDKEGKPVTLLALTLTAENWNLAVAAAYAEGIDLEAMLLTQSEKIEGLDKDGKPTLIDVVRVFLEDDSCGNQVFESHPPTLPPMTIPNTPTTLNKSPKNDSGTVITIPGADPAESDGGNIDPAGAGNGPAGQDVDPTTGTVAGERPIDTQAPASTEAPAPTEAPNQNDETDDTATVVTGTQPETPTAPVTTNQPIPNDSAPAPAPIG